MLRFQPSGLGTKLVNLDTSSIINIDGCFANDFTHANQAIPFLVGQLANSGFLGVQTGFGAKHSLHKLVLGHFQGKEGYRLFGSDSHIGGNIQSKGGFTHTWAGSHQNQI